jgi:hypothetical protein
MTVKLFVALYVGLIVSMFVLLFAESPVGWVFFVFVFVAVFGGLLASNRPYLIVAGFLGVSLIALGAGLFAMRQAWQITTWPTAFGVITRSRSCTVRINGDVAYSGLCIGYRYQVRGQTFEGDSSETREFAGGTLRSPASFPEGHEVNVHYDPRRPGYSRLTADIPIRDWLATFAGAVMAGLSVFTLGWLVWKPEAKPQAAALVNLLGGKPAYPGYQAEPHGASPERVRPDPDIADQLEKLAELHRQQAINDEEYELAKKRLLGLP